MLFSCLNLRKILPNLFLFISTMWFINYLYINAQYAPGHLLVFEPSYLQAKAIISSLPLTDIKGTKLGWGLRPELPLTYGIILTPLAFFKLSNAEQIFQVINLLMLAATLILVAKLLDLRSVRKILLWSIALSLFPVIHCLATGSHAIFLLFFTVLSLYLFYKKQYNSSAVILALASCIGITPFLLIGVFVIHRKYKYCFSFLITVFAIQIITILFCDYSQFYHYWTKVFPTLDNQSTFIYNQSATGYIQRILNHYHVNLSWLSIMIFLSLTCAFFIYCVIKNSQSQKNSCQPLTSYNNDFDAIMFETTIFMIVIQIATPNAWVHYYVWLLLPIAYILKASENKSWGSHNLIIFTIAVFFLFIPMEDFQYRTNSLFNILKSGSILIGSTIIIFEASKIKCWQP